MKYLKRILSLLLVTVVLVSFCTVSTSAESYTHWYTKNGKKSVTLRDVYKSSLEIDGTSLGLSYSLEGINDLYTYNDTLYVLCGTAGKILILDNEYNVKNELAIKNADGSAVDIVGSRGIFVDDNGIIVADTEHAKVLICDLNGVVTKEITKPNSTVIPETFIYKPIKVLRDLRGYTYVLSEGSYYGALLFDDSYEFLGFYGANTTKTSVGDIISNLWDRFFTTNEQKGKQTKTLPYQFSNFCLGKDGFIYTSTGATELWSLGSGQIVKLSPGALNVLYHYDKLGEANAVTGFNFGENTYLMTENTNRMQSFCDLYVDENDFIYTVDKTYGIVYIYDSNCNLISAFGGGFGNGKTQGTFKEPCAITMVGDDVVVADALKRSITVFSLTDFGSRLIAAQKLTIDGKYKEANPYWEKIILEEPNCQMAYTGIANYCLETGDLERGLQIAKDGGDLAAYSEIYENISKNILRKNMGWIFAVIGVIAVALIVLTIRKKKNPKSDEEKVESLRKQKILLPFRMMLHPFDSVNELKYKGKASVPVGLAIAVLYYVLDVISVINGGFLFTTFEVGNFNALFVLAKTAGLIMLWSVANWGICSVLQGKGTLKEVFCVTTYSIIPLLFERIIFIILSNILPLSAAVFLNGVAIVALIYFGFLLISGMLVVHEFTMSKFIWTTILTILGMILVVFIAFVLGIFLQQLGNFFVSVYTEVAYR